MISEEKVSFRCFCIRTRNENMELNAYDMS